MNKYIRGGICASVTLVKFAFLKLVRGKDFQCGLVNNCSPLTTVEINKGGKLTIGKRFKMGSHSYVRVRSKGKLTIGDHVAFNHGNIIVCHDEITFGDNVQVGPNVLFYDHDHDFRAENGLKNLIYKTAPITIGNNVWISANTVVLRGTTIGDDCVIGAGSVVKGNIPAGTVLIQKRQNEFIEVKHD